MTCQYFPPESKMAMSQNEEMEYIPEPESDEPVLAIERDGFWVTPDEQT